jgi:magnesium-protoporphyrin O-methyltransferase
MSTSTYTERRGQLETYFDRTAADAWARLTSTAKVSRIRETVRAGRDQMRTTLLDWLPMNLSGRRILDAGCGTGALAVEAAMRGAEVVAIDLSPTLIELARERLPTQLGEGRIEFHVGDMLSPGLGQFDHVVAMDSLIHYRATDMVDAVQALAARTRHSIQFTFAPSSVLLQVMHKTGKLFPRSDRAPAIEPVAEERLRHLIGARDALSRWQPKRCVRVKSGFYTSQAFEIVHR